MRQLRRQRSGAPVGGCSPAQGGKIVGIDETGRYDTSVGTAVAISAEAGTIVIGGPLRAAGEGDVWIFALYNGVWIQQVAAFRLHTVRPEPAVSA